MEVWPEVTLGAGGFEDGVEFLGPFLFDAESQGVGEEFLEELGSFLGRIFEVEAIFFGDGEVFTEAIDLIEDFSAFAGGGFHEVVEEEGEDEGGEKKEGGSPADIT